MKGIESSTLTNCDSDIEARGSERYLLTCRGSCRFRKWQRIFDWLALQICKTFLVINSYVNSYMWIWNNVWINVHVIIRKPFLIPPKSYVSFMNSYMNSWFSYMNLGYDFICQPFLVPPNSLVFDDFMPDLMDFGLFHGRDHIQIHVWKKYGEKYSDFMEALKRILNWIHRLAALTRSVWQG